MPEEEDVYDVVNEEEYGKVVNSRREREDFVVDDGIINIYPFVFLKYKLLSCAGRTTPLIIK
jgi:hypothetical protein